MTFSFLSAKTARVLSLSLAMAIAVAGCKKAENDPSPEDNLRSGTWRQVSGTMRYKIPGTGADTTIDIFTDAPDCQKDNRLTFNEGFVGRLQLLGTPCVTGEPESKEFNWEVTNAGSILHLYNAQEVFGTDAVDADLLLAETGRFSIRYNIYTNPTPGDRDTSIYTSVFVH